MIDSEWARRAEDAVEETWNDPIRGSVSFRTLFSGDSTPTSNLTTGVAEIPAHGVLALHHHEPAETYFFLDGEGKVALDEKEVEVSAGTSIFIPGGAVHGVRNTGPSPLRFFYVLAADSRADVVYHFSAA